jgi:hypothetical protein
LEAMLIAPYLKNNGKLKRNSTDSRVNLIHDDIRVLLRETNFEPELLNEAAGPIT